MARMKKLTEKERKEWVAAWRKKVRRKKAKAPVNRPQTWSDLQPHGLYLPTTG